MEVRQWQEWMTSYHSTSPHRVTYCMQARQQSHLDKRSSVVMEASNHIVGSHAIYGYTYRLAIRCYAHTGKSELISRLKKRLATMGVPCSTHLLGSI